MKIPEDVLKSFGNLIAKVIEHSAGPCYGMCLSKKHKWIFIFQPLFFLSNLTKNIYQKKMKKPKLDSDYRFIGIKMIPSSDYAITLFHKDYIIYKEN